MFSRQSQANEVFALAQIALLSLMSGLPISFMANLHFSLSSQGTCILKPICFCFHYLIFQNIPYYFSDLTVHPLK